MEKLRDQFARESDPAKQKAIAEAVQARDMEITADVPIGEYVPAGGDAQERRRDC